METRLSWDFSASSFSQIRICNLPLHAPRERERGERESVWLSGWASTKQNRANEKETQKKQNDAFVSDYKAWDLHGNSARLRRTASEWDKMTKQGKTRARETGEIKRDGSQVKPGVKLAILHAWLFKWLYNSFLIVHLNRGGLRYRSCTSGRNCASLRFEI